MSSSSPVSALVVFFLLINTACTANASRDIKWKFEADTLSAFQKDSDLCVKAICDLYRHQISEDAKGVFHDSNAVRGTNLAMFLDIKKSVKDMETLDERHPSNLKARLIAETPKYTPDLSKTSRANHGDPADPPSPSLGRGLSLVLVLFPVFLVIGLLVIIHRVYRAPTPPSNQASTAASAPEIELQPIPSARAPPHGEIVFLQQPGAAPIPMWRPLDA